MKKEPDLNLISALRALVDDKNLDDDIIINALKDALISAARKYLQIHKKIEVDIDTKTNEIRVFLRVEVVDDYPDYDLDMTADEVREFDENYMLLEEAQEFNEDAQPGDVLEMEVPASAFGRQAIQTAKQSLINLIHIAECDKIYETYRSRIGTMVSGEVLRIENKNVLVSIGRQIEAILPVKEQIPKERFFQGSSVKAVILNVGSISSKASNQIVLSRASGLFLKELFKQEVPEIYEGIIEIKGVSRAPGYRAKIAVYSRDERIDPVGACVGMKGSRVQAIVRELANERIDIVHWNFDLETYIRRALAPANIVKMIEVRDSNRIVIVVADEDLAQAIGRNGQNIRLASELVERSLDIFGEKEWSEKGDELKERILGTQNSLNIEALSMDIEGETTVDTETETTVEIESELTIDTENETAVEVENEITVDTETETTEGTEA